MPRSQTRHAETLPITDDISPEQALQQLKAQLQALEERTHAQATARPLRGLVRLAKADSQRIGRSGVLAGVLLGIAVVTGLTAYVAAVVAAVAWLSRSVDTIMAIGFTAVFFALIMMLAFGLVLLIVRRERRWISGRAAIYQDAGGVLMRAALGPRLSAVMTAMAENDPKEASRSTQEA